MNNILERETKTLQGYDLARGLAIFAMVLIDFKAFFCIDETFPEWLYGVLEYMHRRAAVILVMVAGAGMSLMSRRAGGMAKSRNNFFKRAVFLMLCGMLLSDIWPADILHFYGFFILIGLTMTALSNPELWVAATVFWLVGFLGLSDNVCGYLESFTDGSLPGQLADLFFTGYHPVFPWAAIYILGMWVGRQDLTNRHVTILLMVSGFLAAILSECAGHFIPGIAVKTMLAYGVSDQTAAHIFILMSKLTVIDLALPSPVSIISGAGTGLCIIMLSVLCAAGLKQAPRQYFLIAGQNTLSLYVLHILFIKGVENLPGMGEDYPVLWCTAGAILFIAAYMLLIRLWLKKYTIGPFEGAMRYFPFVKPHRIVKAHPDASAG